MHCRNCQRHLGNEDDGDDDDDDKKAEENWNFLISQKRKSDKWSNFEHMWAEINSEFLRKEYWIFTKMHNEIKSDILEGILPKRFSTPAFKDKLFNPSYIFPLLLTI